MYTPLPTAAAARGLQGPYPDDERGGGRAERGTAEAAARATDRRSFDFRPVAAQTYRYICFSVPHEDSCTGTGQSINMLICWMSPQLPY